MAYTSIELNARIRALEDALARGEKSVQYADRTTVFASFEEIQGRIDYFGLKLSDLTTTRRPRQYIGVPQSGF